MTASSTVKVIEPTQEQVKAAGELIDNGWKEGTLATIIARLLAKREHQLQTDLEAERLNVAMLEVAVRDLTADLTEAREELQKERSFAEQMLVSRTELATEVDAAHARIVELEQEDAGHLNRIVELQEKIKDACFSCPGCGRHDFGFFASQIKAACGPCRVRAEKAEARVAELEAVAAAVDKVDERDKRSNEREATHLKRIAELEDKDKLTLLHLGELSHAYTTLQHRETKHLAHIKALEKCLADHEEEEGVWIPRADFKDMPRPLTNAAQDEEKELDAPAAEVVSVFDCVARYRADLSRDDSKDQEDE